MFKKIFHKINENGFCVTLYEVGKVKNIFFNFFFKRRLNVNMIDIDWHGARLVNIKNLKIGENFSARSHLWIEIIYKNSTSAEIVIGKNVKISDNFHVGASNRVSIDDGCLIGSRVLITDHSHGVTPKYGVTDFGMSPSLRPIFSSGPVCIGKNVWLGDGVVVLPNSIIGDGCIVGANSIVRGKLPPNTIWAGNPLRQLWPDIAL